MNSYEIKVLMLKKGLTITSMAEALENKRRKKKSLQTMISDMIYSRAFYPGLAKELKEKYGLKFKRPAQFESARDIVRQAA